MVSILKGHQAEINYDSKVHHWLKEFIETDVSKIGVSWLSFSIETLFFYYYFYLR